MSDLTIKTERLVDAWKHWSDKVEKAKSVLEQTIIEADIAETELARWLIPEDADPGEQFNVWHGSTILCAEKTMLGKFKVSIRKRGK
jgi:aminopeptidase C